MKDISSTARNHFTAARLPNILLKRLNQPLLFPLHMMIWKKYLQQSQKMEHLGRMVITYTMVIKDVADANGKNAPRERFLNFVTRNPELMQRVPQKYLASYLNIKPETFSRFKHLLRNHTKRCSSGE